jgi:hypothetical protein
MQLPLNLQSRPGVLDFSNAQLENDKVAIQGTGNFSGSKFTDRGFGTCTWILHGMDAASGSVRGILGL